MITPLRSLPHFVLFLIGLTLTLAIPARAAAPSTLPEDALNLLKTLPNQRLELPYVVGQAALASDSFKIVQTQRLTTDVASLQATSALDWRPFARVGLTQDEREPANPFAPNRIVGNTISLGAQTLFRSGTAFSLELSKGKNELGFANPQIPRIEYNETRASLNLSQPLWQNALGSGLRAQLASAESASKAAEISADESTEDWLLNLIGLYYNAWLAQAQAQTADTSLARRERLLSMVEILTRRGTSERPDLLQVQSAVEATKVQAGRATQALGDIWRNLVSALKLPKDWMSIDPKLIPMAIDDPTQEAIRLCGSEGLISPAPQGNLGVRRAGLVRESAEASDRAASAQLRPDLSFQAQLANNAIDNTVKSDDSFSEFLQIAHPAWTVGVTLSMPLGFTSEKARKLSATADLIRAEAGAQQAQDDHATQWLNRCLDLFRLERSYTQLKGAFEKQSERARLEEERFRIGRVGTFQVIQAGDDATQAEFTLRSIEVERRQAAWRVRRQAGQAMPWLEETARKLSKQL